jgi:hypothetical protein
MTTQQSPTEKTPSTIPVANAPNTTVILSSGAVKPNHKHTNDEHYQLTCKACRLADAERSRPGFCSIPEADLARTTFLVPDSQYDNAVCRAYLLEKYPDAPYIGSSIDLAKLGGYAEGEQLVVVRRDSWPRPPAEAQTREKDVEGKWQYSDVDPQTLIGEVVEMAPLNIKFTIQLSAADRFTKSKLDISPLTRRLAELMAYPYRIDLPRDPRDTVAYFIHQ